MDILSQDITYLKGVGPKKAELLQTELGIFTFEDLLYNFPFRYVDKSQIYPISEVTANMQYVQIKGVISKYTKGKGRGPKLKALFRDDSGIVELTWFKGDKWIIEQFPVGKQIIIFGKPTFFNGGINIVHPEMDLADKQVKVGTSGLQPVYGVTEKLKNSYVTPKNFATITASLLSQIDTFPETLPKYILDRYKLITRKEAIYNMHFPTDNNMLEKAKFRLKFEELFFIQVKLLRIKFRRTDSNKGFLFPVVGDFFNKFYNDKLPFVLTGAQKRVIKEIRLDTANGKQMNRLVQGDVGSGKTMVALMSMLLAIDNGFQACLMAPTEILSQQHYNSILKMSDGLGIKMALLTGSTRVKQRREIHESLLDGSLNILIGTHALIEDVVKFKNLGLTVIDEQHRFGVAQRAKLHQKNYSPPHILVMTATPIPRTLSMTLYGDLDISVIDELPPGRKPIITAMYNDSKRRAVFGFMKKQIALGRQIYIVYPLIKESEKLDLKDLEDGYASITSAFPRPEYQTSILHGKMKPADKNIEMDMFKTGKTQIMVSTTVIEVGVDVPNANVMIIENAERFGLSQLHQLRGRVGRGDDQSYCLLMSSYKLSANGKKRLETMVATNDGFEIAEADMRLRGPGDMDGTRQSGMAFDLKVASIAQDGAILQLARDCASEILERDINLEQEPNTLIKKGLQKIDKSNFVWRDIS